MTRRLLVLTAALALGLGAAPPALAEGGDTAAVAVNTRDGASVFRFAFAIKRVLGEVVDNANAAVSYASCTSCTTVAISFQVVLASGSPSEVTPENLALAFNNECLDCQTLASAYQFVLGVGDAPVRFSAEGNRALADIRRRLQALRSGDLTVEEVQAQADALAGELAAVLREELVRTGAAPPPPPPPSATAEAPPPATTAEEPAATTAETPATTGTTTGEDTGTAATTTETTPTTTASTTTTTGTTTETTP